MLKVRPKVEVTSNSILGLQPSIKIYNFEPVKLSDVFIEVIRYKHSKFTWNDIESLTSQKNNNFISKGFEDNNRTIARTPVFIQIAQEIQADGFTEILFDDYSAFIPLEIISDTTSSREFEMVFKITGQFEDEDKSNVLGFYYGLLVHNQIKATGNVARIDVFSWKKFEQTSIFKDKQLKTKREEELGFKIS